MLATALGAALALAALPQEAPSNAGAEPARYERVYTRARVEVDGQHTSTLELRVRLGTAEGVAEFGEIAIPYLEGSGDVQFQEVVIEKANGRRVEVKGIVEDVNPFGLTSGATPADVRAKKLTIPGLEPGDTLSYRIVHREAPIAPGHMFGELDLSPLAGVTAQIYELDLPRAAGIRVRLREGLGPWTEMPAAADRLLRRLVVSAEPPSGTPPVSTAASRSWIEPDVTYTSFRSWNEVASWWWAMSKDRLAPDAALGKEAAELAARASDARGRLAALFPFVASRIRYVNVSFGLGRMRPRFAAEVLRDRYGDCKDKHALLAALASSLGIDVRPVLVNSERDVLYDDVPGPQQFDHMISVARLGPSPAEWLWLDGTNAYGPPGYLSPELRDKPALLVESDGTALMVRTPREPPFVSRWETTFKGALDAEGVLRGHTTSILRSDVEPALRATLAALPREQWAMVVKGVLGMVGDLPLQNVVVSDPLDAAAPLRMEFDLEKHLEASGGERALPLPLPALRVPAVDESRAESEPAVTFDVREMVSRAEIELPEGQTARAPLSVSLERPFATFRSVYATAGRMLKAERTLTLPTSVLEEAHLPAYQSLRDAVTRDGKQEFTVEGAAAATSADGLQREGAAAFSKQDYATAVERLSRAAELDPKRQDVFEYLGRALYGLGRDTEAVAAFTRQIEVAPFSEYAYAWRAHALTRLGREDEAEKDLLKQIEVAPFNAWSHERLAERRWRQDRLEEAAAFYERAAAIEPRSAKRWLDLADTQSAAGMTAEARVSLDRTMGLSPESWMKVRAAVTYRKLGDVARAGAVAEGALPAIRDRLAQVTPEGLDESDLYWMDRLLDAWRLAGEAAGAGGDLARAQRYLEAAWHVGLQPEAAWLLGEVREKQGRPAQAVELWRLSASVRSPAPLPLVRAARLKAAADKLALEPAALPDPALMTLRTVRLAGPALASLAEEVLLLVNADGHVQRVSNLSRRDAEAFERQLPQLGRIRIGWPLPDAEPVKLVRRGVLACEAGQGCQLVLDLPGGESVGGRITGWVSITALEPGRDAVLKRGQQVSLTVTVRYRIDVDTAVAALVVQDQRGRRLADGKVTQVLRSRSGEATLKGTFTVPGKATEVYVLVPISSNGDSATTIVDAARFRAQGP